MPLCSGFPDMNYALATLLHVATLLLEAFSPNGKTRVRGCDDGGEWGHCLARKDGLYGYT